MKMSDVRIEEELKASQGRACFAPQELNETQRVLKRALELLGPNGEVWCGQNHCIHTAIMDAEEEMGFRINLESRAVQTVERALRVSSHYSIYRWNDKPNRTFAEVRGVFNRAIALAANT